MATELCKVCYRLAKKSTDYKTKRTGISILDEDGKTFAYPDNAIRREINNIGCPFEGKMQDYLSNYLGECEF